MTNKRSSTPPTDQPAADSGSSLRLDPFEHCARAGCATIEELEVAAAASQSPPLTPGCDGCIARWASIRANQSLLAELGSVLDPAACLGSASDAADAEPVPTIAGYTISDPISAGGQATVYRAMHDASQRIVAIKVMKGVRADPEGAARLERELQILARFRHPGIVTVHDGGRTAEGLPYIVMELVEGGTLKEWAPAQAFHASRAGIRDAARLVATIASTVAAAQRTGLIHRDLKPSNILIDEQGQPRVADFGVAHQRERSEGAASDHSTTQAAGGFVGSIAYAAPEQFSPGSVVDARSDAFSLGLILREMVVGQRLTRDPTRPTKPATAQQANPLVPADLERIITRATALDPDERYPSAAELAQDLNRWLTGHPIQQRQHDRLHVAHRFIARHPIAMGVAACFALILVAYAITITRSAALIHAQNLSLERRLKEREAVMSAMSEPLAALDTDASLEAVRDINELLLRAAGAIETHLGDEPDLQSRLLSRVGLALLYRREYDAAERFLTKAAAIEASLAGSNGSPRLGETLHDLGRLAWNRAATDRAHAEQHLTQSAVFYERAYQAKRASLAGDDPSLALTMSHLGATYSALGRFDEADAMFGRVLAAHEASASERPLDLVASLMSIGSHRYRKNDLEGSEQAYARAEAVARQAEAGLPLASAINARGLLLLELDRPAQASQKFREASELRLALLGPHDADYLASQRDLALALLEADDPEQARLIAFKVGMALPLGGERAKGFEKITSFISSAAIVRTSEDPESCRWLHEMWQELSAQPRAASRTDRRAERLRASVGLEYLAAHLKFPSSSPSISWTYAASGICDVVRQDLQSLVPSPRQRRDLERLDSLCQQLRQAAARDTIEP